MYNITSHIYQTVQEYPLSTMALIPIAAYVIAPRCVGCCIGEIFSRTIVGIPGFLSGLCFLSAGKELINSNKPILNTVFTVIPTLAVGTALMCCFLSFHDHVFKVVQRPRE